jgi:hypothetical protein
VGDIEKRRDNEEKKTRKDGLVHRRVYYKKKAKEKEATETRKDKALGERARRKKREVRGDWLVHFDNWNEDDKETLSPVRREKKERWKETLFAFDRKKRERKKMCIYRIRSTARPTQQISLHSFSRNSSKLVFSSSHIYIYNIEDKMRKRRCMQRVI